MAYWYRYAHGDEAIFVHEGTGMFESQFGTLQYGPGDYLVIPTGVIWRILPDDRRQPAHARRREHRVDTSSRPSDTSISTASFSRAHPTPSGISGRLTRS